MARPRVKEQDKRIKLTITMDRKTRDELKQIAGEMKMSVSGLITFLTHNLRKAEQMTIGQYLESIVGQIVDKAKGGGK